MTKQVLEVQGYGLGEFCKNVQDAVDQGYRFDLESNENYPSSFGAFMRCIMVKSDLITQSPPNTASETKTESALSDSQIEEIIEDAVEEAVEKISQTRTKSRKA